jgi:hypothetical protein
VIAVAALPPLGGTTYKVEGLALLDTFVGGVHLLAVVDVDDPETASLELMFRVRW